MRILGPCVLALTLGGWLGGCLGQAPRCWGTVDPDATRSLEAAVAGVMHARFGCDSLVRSWRGGGADWFADGCGTVVRFTTSCGQAREISSCAFACVAPAVTVTGCSDQGRFLRFSEARCASR